LTYPIEYAEYPRINKGEKMIKEYADISEDFELSLNGEKIKVKHHCKKTFKDQNPQAIEDLKSHIESELKENKKDGFIPYDNFECSVHWNIIDNKPKQLEFPFPELRANV
tara:strand:- start:322 stop:651 length:330 start_codon:yes stop_codon:yes gene_type:complete